MFKSVNPKEVRDPFVRKTDLARKWKTVNLTHHKEKDNA
jgi:hypothetical protein